MPSTKHQEVVFWLVRKILRDGYYPIGIEGECPRGGFLNQISVSVSIGGVHPDVVAVNPLNLLVAFGEAKTEGDLSSPHSQMQLKAMSSYRDPLGRSARIYLGVPHSIQGTALRQLARLGLFFKEDIQVLPVPDILLPEVENV